MEGLQKLMHQDKFTKLSSPFELISYFENSLGVNGIVVGIGLPILKLDGLKGRVLGSI